MHEDIIERLTNVENVIAQFDDEIGNDAGYIRKECAVVSPDTIRAKFAGLEDEYRLLSIGIVGRMKAGKSSLLNSIFFESKPVLPKAATPKTASLTIMTHGDTFSVTVEYFSDEDIKAIKKDHDAYEAERNRRYVVEEKADEDRAKSRRIANPDWKPDREKIRNRVNKDMEEHPKHALYLQYEEMRGIQAPKESPQTLTANTIDELMGKLNEYVGSGGRMTAYTKSVEICLTGEDALRDIRVVDTPGIDDPVKSREARTEEYLNECNVVFIISPSGAFIKDVDLGLMDKLTTKKGVDELYLVASKADTQFYGSEKKDTPDATIQQVRGKMFSQAKETLSNLVRDQPEAAKQFDKLINGGKERVMITSATCHDMYTRFDDRDSWDKGMNKTWELLCDAFPDHFSSPESAKTNLEQLSGIKEVKEKIDLARSKRKEILAENMVKSAEAQLKTINDFSQKLKERVKARIVQVENTDIEEVRNRKKENETLISRGAEAIDGTFEDCVDDFKSKIRSMVSEKSRTLFQAVKNDNANQEQSQTKTGSRTKYVFFDLIPWGSESYSYEVRTLRTGIVKSNLNDLVANLQDLLVDSAEEAKKEWKVSVQGRVTNALTEAVGDRDNLIDFGMLKTALRRLVSNMELPNLDIGSNRFSSSFSGTIEDEDIDRFDDEWRGFLANLQNIFIKARDEFLSTMEKTAKREKISGMIFTDIQEQLDKLEKDIKQKKYTLEKLKKCLSALEKTA